MAPYIRVLSIDDLDRCSVVESAAFPPAEAATREKIDYRLSVCPELCLGLFVPGNSTTVKPEGDIPVFTAPPTGSDNDKLIAHVIATKSTSRVVKDEDMSFPETWKTDPTAQYGVGHQAEGRTIALHSLAVSPSYQRSGFGKKLMKSYIEYMRQHGQADRISILTYDRLLPYYQTLGFTHYGKSASETIHSGLIFALQYLKRLKT
ncbi:acetyltransferase [Colletotrichum camelliae]|nr:acetyltransferase [Colletotrichum camelliae]